MSEYKLFAEKKKLAGVPVRPMLSPKNLLLMGVPREFHDLDLETWQATADKSVSKVVTDYVEDLHSNFENGVGFFLYGSNGSGKSRVASLLAIEYYRHRYTARFATLNKAIPIGVKSGYDEEIKAEYYAYYLNVDLLVLDEVGKEQSGEKRANVTILEEILRHRNFAELPTIVITNLNPKDFEETYGSSIYSLMKHHFIPIKMAGEDKRKIKYKELLAKLVED
jgi:DNA replication protein DnaC